MKYVQTEMIMHKRDNMEVDISIKKIVKKRTEGSSANHLKNLLIGSHKAGNRA